MPSPVAFSTAQERDGSGSSCYPPPRVELSSFVSLLAERWGGGGVMNGRDPKDSCPKLKAVLEKGRREKTALDSQILSPSVQLGIFYFLSSVVCRAYNAPSLQIPVLKTRRMGTHGSEISPWRHPILPLFQKPNPVPPFSGAQRPYSPEAVLAQLPPPRVENSWKLWCAPTAPRATLPGN